MTVHVTRWLSKVTGECSPGSRPLDTMVTSVTEEGTHFREPGSKYLMNDLPFRIRDLLVLEWTAFTVTFPEGLAGKAWFGVEIAAHTVLSF